MTSANLLIVIIVGTVVGALTGLGLGGYFGNQLYLAILAGFLGTIIGALARNFIMARRSGRVGRLADACTGDRLCCRRLAGGQRRGAGDRAAKPS